LTANRTRGAGEGKGGLMKWKRVAEKDGERLDSADLEINRRHRCSANRYTNSKKDSVYSQVGALGDVCAEHFYS